MSPRAFRSMTLGDARERMYIQTETARGLMEAPQTSRLALIKHSRSSNHDPRDECFGLRLGSRSSYMQATNHGVRGGDEVGSAPRS